MEPNSELPCHFECCECFSMAALVFVCGLVPDQPEMMEKLSNFTGHNSTKLESPKEVRLRFLWITKHSCLCRYQLRQGLSVLAELDE
jgi:hypothetical protein